MILGCCTCASARQNAQSSTSLSQSRDWRTCSGQKRGQPNLNCGAGAWKGMDITLHYMIFCTICEFDMILTTWRLSEGPAVSLLITHPESEGIFRWSLARLFAYNSDFVFDSTRISCSSWWWNWNAQTWHETNQNSFSNRTLAPSGQRCLWGPIIMICTSPGCVMLCED